MVSNATTSSNLLRLLLAVALIVAASARGSSSSPRPAPAPAPSSKDAAAAPAPAPAPKHVEVSWGFPHAPRPRVSLSPGDTLTFTWDQVHGVYSLGKFADIPSSGKKGDDKAKVATPAALPEPKCEDFKDFRDARDFLTVEPRREGYYGPQHGSVSWTAPQEEGVYAFADPIEQNCWAGMLLVVDVERPKAVVVAAPAPAPAPAKGKSNNNNNDKNNKKPAAAVAVVPAAAPAPAPAAASAAAAVSVASVDKAPEPVSPSQQAAAGEVSFAVEEETSRAEAMGPRERHAARVAEREAAREQRQAQRAIEEGRVDFEGQQHVIED